MSAANAVGLHDQGHQVGVLDAIECHRSALFKAHPHRFTGNGHVIAPESHAHDGVDDGHAAVQVLQVFRLVGRAQHIGICGVGLFGRHLVAKSGLRHEGRHLSPATQFINKQLIQPGFVDLERRVGQQAVTVKTLDVIALEGAAVAPDVDVVLLHGRHQHGAGHSATDRGGVEVGEAAGGDMESATLQGGDALCGQLGAAIHQACQLRAVLHGLARDLVVVGFVGLAQIGGVGIGQGALEFHPVQRCAGVEAARESDADFLTERQVLENRGHGGLRDAVR